MRLSIVATLYRSGPHLLEFHARCSKAAQAQVGQDYEIVLVNDGSPDESLQLAVNLAETDPHLVVVDLSRNFGHHRAIMVGLSHARGDLVYLLDSDLEEQPEWLAPFVEELQDTGCDVVFGVQVRRKGGLFERWSGASFYKLLRTLTGLPLPENPVTARVMTRRYVDALLQHREREIFLAGLWFITGFEQRAVPVVKLSTSETTYTLRRKIALLVNSVTSFSNAPLIIIFYLGVCISFLAGLGCAYLVYRWMFQSRPPSGWTSVIASIWLLGGLIISFIGVVGIYLSRIYSETKQRPYSIVRRVYRSGDA
jgi:putative glycosyltransferase